MPWPDREWLEDIPEAASEIESYVAGISFEDFAGQSMRRDATLQQLAVIGEAAARLGKDIRDRYPDVDRADWRNAHGGVSHRRHEPVAT